ncbi:hypothetical protein [Azoarcus olearius]|uniref:hypothetical protein n=1 Tax=Azoarcus sp. (strain BH72) TaxID=418699 RepID=UPI0012EE6EF2|nr:hypothetical protein [Azoarcus olearius]
MYRHHDLLKFSQAQLSARSLATFLVAQGVEEIGQLEVRRAETAETDNISAYENAMHQR